MRFLGLRLKQKASGVRLKAEVLSAGAVQWGYSQSQSRRTTKGVNEAHTLWAHHCVSSTLCECVSLCVCGSECVVRLLHAEETQKPWRISGERNELRVRCTVFGTFQWQYIYVWNKQNWEVKLGQSANLETKLLPPAHNKKVYLEEKKKGNTTDFQRGIISEELQWAF